MLPWMVSRNAKPGGNLVAGRGAEILQRPVRVIGGEELKLTTLCRG